MSENNMSFKKTPTMLALLVMVLAGCCSKNQDKQLEQPVV